MKRYSAFTAALALVLFSLECFAQVGADRESTKVSGKAENKAIENKAVESKAIWKFDTHG